ncbi:restriction endonuclease subunit S [uncultured Methanolobus sp.]|uniref:restriction endonuclease subunit S n=1 Tax=uncultured Methanolobus sp. TaxID=218300 RepID=UPI002AAA73C8|nr:restriction endonuclease subunit S [uncultured Methanolobus sp.]
MKLPDGWRKERLSNISIIQTGIAKNQNNIENSIELPYLRVANVQEGFFDLNEIKTIRIPHEKIKRYKLISGDVLLTEGGDFDKLGRGAVWYEQIKDCVHQNHIFVVRPNNKHIISEFLSAQTGSTYGKKYFISCSKQSTNLASINSTQLKAFPVILPPLPEQKAIADLLSTWDETIEITERLIQAKEKQFKGNTQKLIDLRCTEWTHIKPKNMFDLITEKNHPNEELLSVTQDQGVIPRDMLKGRVMSPDGTTASYKHIKPGDFVISLRSFQGGIEYSKYQGIISPAYTVLRPKIKMDTDFYQIFFKTYIFIEKYLNLAVIGIRDGKQISIPDFLSIKIPLPPLEEQKRIAETLSVTQQEIDILKQLAEKYKTQKRGLMQKMLTGEWRVMSDVVKSYEENTKHQSAPEKWHSVGAEFNAHCE